VFGWGILKIQGILKTRQFNWFPWFSNSIVCIKWWNSINRKILCLGRQQNKGFCYSNWSTCPNTRKPTTEFCFFLGLLLISWKCKKQSIVSHSSSEAEYWTLALAKCEVQLLFVFHSIRRRIRIVDCRFAGGGFLIGCREFFFIEKFCFCNLCVYLELSMYGRIMKSVFWVETSCQYGFAKDYLWQGLPTTQVVVICEHDL
jgi:hypothetical protein